MGQFLHRGRPGDGFASRAALYAVFCFALAGCVSVREEPLAPAVFYPPLPQRPRIQFLRTLGSSADVLPEQSWFARFVLGDYRELRAQSIVRPYGMALWEGKLYVCDSGARKVLVLDFERQEVRTFGKMKGSFALGLPINISLDPQGHKYITDTLRGQVLVLDRDDEPVRVITNPGGLKPCDAVWHEQELFVTDLKTNTIQIYDPESGRLLRQFGRSGSEPGEFSQPTNIALGPEGHLYVSDTLNARVQKLDSRGNFVGVIGSRGMALGQMVRPKGIAVDRAARLYVADAATDSVQLYDPDGRLLLILGGPGSDPGELSLPAKVVISYEGIEYFTKYASPEFRIEYLIFVSSHLGPNKVSVYGFGTYLGPIPEEVDDTTLPRPQPVSGDGETR